MFQECDGYFQTCFFLLFIVLWLLFTFLSITISFFWWYLSIVVIHVIIISIIIKFVPTTLYFFLYSLVVFVNCCCCCCSYFYYYQTCDIYFTSFLLFCYFPVTQFTVSYFMIQLSLVLTATPESGHGILVQVLHRCRQYTCLCLYRCGVIKLTCVTGNNVFRYNYSYTFTSVIH